MSFIQFDRASSSRPARGRSQAPTKLSQITVVDYAGHLVPPLHWWRSLPAPAFSAVHLAVIRKAVTGFGIIGEPRWPDAAMGDAAAAVGVALRAIKRRRTPSPGLDLVMSALLRCAIAGNVGAVHALMHVLGQMVTRDPSCALIAESWRSSTTTGQRRRMSHGG